MIKLYFIYQMFDSFALLFKSKLDLKKKINLFFIWSKINFKYFFLSPFINFTSENFLNIRVEFFNYESFRYLFEEVFIRNEYYFETKKRSPVIFDCGANIGITTLYFKWLYPKSSIFSFEADKTSFKKLKTNIKINDLKNVNIMNLAISNKNGYIKFYSNPNDPGSMISSTSKERAIYTETTVKSIKISSFITKKSIGEIDLMKMDIEGSEFESIADLSKLNMLKLFNEIILEYHHNIAEKNNSLANFLKTFETNKFKYQVYSKPVPLYEKNKFQDILIYFYK